MGRSKNSQNNFEREQNWKSYTAWFQDLYETAEINRVWYWYKTEIYIKANKQNPEVDSHTYRQLISAKIPR
jgi:hypothetical protein